MSKYFIDYGTGAGNEYVTGELKAAKKVADEGACYTQTSISIYSVDDEGNHSKNPVASRTWYSVPFDPDLYEDGEDAYIIKFGNEYFDEWTEEY